MIENRNGDLLAQADINVIAHCANCQCTMGSGIAKAIREKYPEAYEADLLTTKGDEGKLGSFSWAKVRDGLYVANLYGQYRYGNDGARYLNYEAIYRAMNNMHNQVLDSKKPLVIGLPYKMGCDRAGGAWPIVEAMIKDIFEHSPLKLVIVKL